MNATRPKKKPAKKRNQIMARKRKAILLNALSEAVHAARGTKPKTMTAKAKTVKPKTAASKKTKAKA